LEFKFNEYSKPENCFKDDPTNDFNLTIRLNEIEKNNVKHSF